MDKLREQLDTNAIMQFKLYDDIHIWPLVRYSLLLGLTDIKQENENAISLKSKIYNLIKGVKNIKLKRAKIVFITSVLFNVKMNNGFYKNILDDYYCEVFPDESYTYEYIHPSTFKSVNHRVNNETSSLLSYLDVLITLISKVIHGNAAKDIELFADFLKIHNVPEHIQELALNRLYKHAYEYKVRRFVYSMFLKIVQPKMLFINCASYGDKNSILINEAKKQNIKIAEIQHGGISDANFMYNIPDELSMLNHYMPDYLMTFGTIYDSVNNSSKKIAVGHPHLDYKKDSIENDSIQSNSYLFVSQWPVLDELVELAFELSQLNDELFINYRLHPMDNLTQKHKKMLSQKNIIITGQVGAKDLYDEFGCYESIVGCYSTALMEATAFNKKVYVLKHRLSLKHKFDEVGILIDNAQDILQNDVQNNAEFYYVSGFKQRYEQFIKSIGILS